MKPRYLIVQGLWNARKECARLRKIDIAFFERGDFFSDSCEQHAQRYSHALAARCSLQRQLILSKTRRGVWI